MNLSKYTCQEGDRIDLITLDTYGDLEMLPKVLASNVHLSKMPLILEQGTVIHLPVQSQQISQPAKRKGALW